MDTARIVPALALLAAVLGGCRTASVTAESEPQWEACLACFGLYPGACVPAATCEPDIRLMVPRTPARAEDAPIPVAE